MKEVQVKMSKERNLKRVEQNDRTKNKYFNQTRDKKKQEKLSIQNKSDNNAQYDVDSAQSVIKLRKIFDHVRDKNDANKTKTYFIILCVSFVCVFPVYVIHFYRVYNNTSSKNYDNSDLIDWRVYTAFTFLSYAVFIIKALFAFAQNKFYRDAFYQAANIRGFRGKYHFQYDNRQNVQEEEEEEEEANKGKL